MAMAKVKYIFFTMPLVIYSYWSLAADSHCADLFQSYSSGRYVREAKIRPRPNDMEIPADIMDWAEQESIGNNNPAEVLAFGRLNRGLEQPVIARARAILLDRIERAATFTKSGDLDSAIQTLNDPVELRQTKFYLLGEHERAEILPGLIFGPDERTYSNQMVHSFEPRARVSANGMVSIPNPPHESGPEYKIVWSKREWIRTVSEELGHVAQILGWTLNADQGWISAMMSGENSVVRSIVALESGGLHLPIQRERYFWAAETDLYAYLVETYGSDFVPAWFGSDSGYTLRELVDKEFTRKGMPNREWIEPPR